MNNTDDKHFLKYNQQMKYLRDTKHIECNGTKHKIILCRAGYFNLINGYKNPFVQRVNANNQHIYYPNISIENIKSLYDFDEELKLLLFRYLTRAENEVRTIAGYQFDLVNYPRTTWTDTDSYNVTNKTDAVETISKIYNELSHNNFEYVKFYFENHDFIPSWILVKAIKFETFINFLRICKNPVKDSICNLYHIYDNQGRPSHQLLKNMLYWIKKVRNCCAHNERVYSVCNAHARVNETYLSLMPSSYMQDRDQKVFDVVIYLKYFLQPNEYNELIDSLKTLFIDLNSKCSQNVFDKIKSSFGLKNINDFDILKTNPNTKNYNNY